MTLSLVLCLTAGKAAMVASRASSFYHSTLSSASQKKYSPHITDSSTPRPLCTWYTPPLRTPSHLASGLARCFSHSDRRIRTAVDQYRCPFIESGASRHRRSSPAAQIAADDVSSSVRFSAGALKSQGGTPSAGE